MFAIALDPFPGPTNPKRIGLCGDPISSGGPGYWAMHYPLNSQTWLSIDVNGHVSAAATIGPNEIVQIAPAPQPGVPTACVVEVERAGEMLFAGVSGLQ